MILNFKMMKKINNNSLIMIFRVIIKKAKVINNQLVIINIVMINKVRIQIINNKNKILLMNDKFL